MFFGYKKWLGRTETRTRDRMYLGRIQSVRDISRDDRARIATCSLRTPTDRLKANYSTDVVHKKVYYFADYFPRQLELGVVNGMTNGIAMLLTLKYRRVPC